MVLARKFERSTSTRYLDIVKLLLVIGVKNSEKSSFLVKKVKNEDDNKIFFSFNE